MPLYFFNVSDDLSTVDTEGVELPNIYSARAEAVKLSGELLRDMGARFWDGSEWSLQVVDEGRRVLFTLRFSVEEGAVYRSDTIA